MKRTFLFGAIAMALSAAALAADFKEIRFGVDASYPPFESKAPDGKVVGFDVDLGNEICRRLNARCVWIENDFDGLIPALKAKKFDGILSSLSMTDKRLQEIDFTNKVFKVPSRLIARANSNLQPTPQSLHGKRVGVEQGTTQEDYAKAKWAPTGVEIVSYQNQDQVVADLMSGRLDASFQDAIEANEGFLKKPQGKGFAYAGPEVLDKKYLGEGAGIGVRKADKPLKEAINKALADIHKDGTYDKLQKKYFDFDIYGN
ncbi:MAG: ABC transporter substrate-binding protein [Burkholderiales bacterium]|nr:ABC transporter substrate-binding protein [Burkholderiales bacterium]